MIADLLEPVLLAVCVVAAAGWLLARFLLSLGARWHWALLAVPAGLLLRGSGATLPLWLVGGAAALAGARMERAGAPRRSPEARGSQAIDGTLEVGVTASGRPVQIACEPRRGSHVLVLGATGSGKTVTEAWICSNMIADGHAALVIDPKGDSELRASLAKAAERRAVRLLEWTPEGPSSYNPYAAGSAGEVADKALTGEEFSEPHYMRQAQRYLGHVARAMREASLEITPTSLLDHMDPKRLEQTARSLAEPQARAVHGYLDAMSDRQMRDLGGVRDRLAVLAESEIGRWLEPGSGPQLEIEQALREHAVVYMCLDADRRPLLAQMLGAAVVSDLVTMSARAQRDPLDAVVLIDEFAAVAAASVARLFGRARSAGVTLVLGAQELADLRSQAGRSIREQVLGNVNTVVAHRQGVPESAALVSRLAGRRAEWQTTNHSGTGLVRSHFVTRRARRRELVPRIEPEEIAALSVGTALVIRSGGEPQIARIHRPARA